MRKVEGVFNEGTSNFYYGRGAQDYARYFGLYKNASLAPSGQQAQSLPSIKQLNFNNWAETFNPYRYIRTSTACNVLKAITANDRLLY